MALKWRYCCPQPICSVAPQHIHRIPISMLHRGVGGVTTVTRDGNMGAQCPFGGRSICQITGGAPILVRGSVAGADQAYRKRHRSRFPAIHARLSDESRSPRQSASRTPWRCLHGVRGSGFRTCVWRTAGAAREGGARGVCGTFGQYWPSSPRSRACDSHIRNTTYPSSR